MMAIPTVPEHDEIKPGLPRPDAEVTNPASGKIEKIFRNIENEPLIKKIKKLEEKLEALMGKRSVEADLEETAAELDGRKFEASKRELDPEDIMDDELDILKELLDDFNELLKTPYGSLGYLVKSNSEDIKKLYGVDTDRDYYFRLEGSVIRISSRRLEEMVAAGGGKRFISEEGLLLYDPAETPNNAMVSDHAIHEIIYAIHKKIEGLKKVRGI